MKLELKTKHLSQLNYFEKNDLPTNLEVKDYPSKGITCTSCLDNCFQCIF